MSSGCARSVRRCGREPGGKPLGVLVAAVSTAASSAVGSHGETYTRLPWEFTAAGDRARRLRHSALYRYTELPAGVAIDPKLIPRGRSLACVDGAPCVAHDQRLVASCSPTDSQRWGSPELGGR
jgi:hypothetical protein